MKKGILSLILGLLFIGTALSQVRKVNIDINGNFEIVVQVDNGTVIINSTGDVVDSKIAGNVEYKGDKLTTAGKTEFGYDRLERIVYAGITNFRYDFSGNMVSARNIKFEYNSIGKISAIGKTKIEYNSAGKISSIGNTNFEYDSSGKISSGERAVSNKGLIIILKD